MSTNYNIFLDLREKEKAIPQNIFDLCKRQFEDVGLIGEKHINYFGRVFQGYDQSCDVYVKGHFDIFKRDSNLSMREIIKQKEITSSGFNELEQETIALGEEVVDILEKNDPLATLPYNVYSNLPMIQSMELNTACGIQSTHVHTKEGRIIQFWKPKKDRYWYDSDTFKNHLFFINFVNNPVPTFQDTFLTHLKYDIKEILYKKHRNLFDSFIKNPDSIKKVGFLL